MSRIVFLVAALLIITGSFGLAEAAVTAGKHFCSSFPTNPECTGWRVQPIYDNFWFCEYVDLPSLCKYLPNPQKQITSLSADNCCRLFDDDLVSPKDLSPLYYDESYSKMIREGITLSKTYPVNELVIWTDKDHYDFGDRVNVYGKFDFNDPVIRKSNEFVDVEFNGKKVMHRLPVRDNGWFAGFFFMDDPRYHISGISKIDIPYIHKPTKEDSDKLVTASFQFTTGNIKEPTEPFFIQLSTDTFSQGEPISYWTDPANPVPLNLKPTLISRITNPDGVSFSLPTNSMKDLDDYINKISNLHSGNYTITMTVGNFTTSEKFEYVE